MHKCSRLCSCLYPCKTPLTTVTKVCSCAPCLLHRIEITPPETVKNGAHHQSMAAVDNLQLRHGLMIYDERQEPTIAGLSSER